MAGITGPWDAELNTAGTYVVNLIRAVADLERHHNWLITVDASGEADWKTQGADDQQIATLRGAFDQLHQAAQVIYGNAAQPDPQSLLDYAWQLTKGQ